MSSAVVFLRAVIMLACLVALPIAALFYGPLPPSTRVLLDKALQMGERALNGDASRPQTRLVAAPLFPAPGSAAPAATTPVAPPASSPQQMAISATDPPAAPVQVQQNAPPTKAAALQRPIELAKHLQTLGASHYALQQWGPGSELYRFTCRVAIADNPGHNRHFEAVGDDAQTAIRDVIARVESWRNQQAQRWNR